MELQAASNFFGVPVYIGMLNLREVYCWFLFKVCTIIIPQLDHNAAILLIPFYPKNIEMVQNSSRNHNDSIVPIFAGAYVQLQHPHMHTQAMSSTIEIYYTTTH